MRERARERGQEREGKREREGEEGEEREKDGGKSARKDRMESGRIMSFLPPSLKVFAGIYPLDQSEYVSLRTAIDKLTLNDSSVAVHRDSSIALGQGWRVGFLGLLHMDVFRQRLEEVWHDREKEGEGGRKLRNKDKKMVSCFLSHSGV